MRQVKMKVTHGGMYPLCVGPGSTDESSAIKGEIHSCRLAVNNARDAREDLYALAMSHNNSVKQGVMRIVLYLKHVFLFFHAQYLYFE